MIEIDQIIDKDKNIIINFNSEIECIQIKKDEKSSNDKRNKKAICDCCWHFVKITTFKVVLQLTIFYFIPLNHPKNTGRINKTSRVLSVAICKDCQKKLHETLKIKDSPDSQ